MEVSEFIKSAHYLPFLDEELRNHAYEAVDIYFCRLNGEKPAKKSQLHSLPSIIKANGLNSLKELTKNQKDKNTNQINKIFWSFIYDLLCEEKEYTLFTCVKSKLQTFRCFDDVESAEKKEQKNIKRANRTKIEELMNHVLNSYFDCFMFHYFYRLAMKGDQG